MLRNSAFLRSALMALAGAAIVAAGVFVVVSDANAGRASAGKISFVKGKAQRSANGRSWTTLYKGSSFYAGDRIKTNSGARLEATLSEGSVLRLGGSSEIRLDSLKINKKKKKRKVKAKLVVGRVWAKVTSWFGGNDTNFEVETENAVAGVRGTVFATSKGADGTTEVKVYSGKVLVSNQPIYAVKGHTKANRVEVAGPAEVSKKQWEELIAGAMQTIRVASSGAMTKPQEFKMAEAGGDDDWEAWNDERDKLAAK